MSILTNLNINQIVKDLCVDSDNGKSDKYGEECSYYYNNPDECGNRDWADFNAKQLCCPWQGHGGMNIFVDFQMA